MHLVFGMFRVSTKDLMKLSAGLSKPGPLKSRDIPQDSAQQDTAQANTEHEQPRPLTDAKDHDSTISLEIPPPPPYKAAYQAAYKAEPCEAGPSNTSRIWQDSAQQDSARGNSEHEQPWPLTDTNQKDTTSSPDTSSPLPNDLSAGAIEQAFDGGFPPNNQSLADSLGGPSSIRGQNGSPCNLDDDVPRQKCILQDPDGWCRHTGPCKFNQTDQATQTSWRQPASQEETDVSESASPAKPGCCGPLALWCTC